MDLNVMLAKNAGFVGGLHHKTQTYRDVHGDSL